jgi:hypothetical protein
MAQVEAVSRALVASVAHLAEDLVGGSRERELQTKELVRQAWQQISTTEQAVSATDDVLKSALELSGKELVWNAAVRDIPLRVLLVFTQLNSSVIRSTPNPLERTSVIGRSTTKSFMFRLTSCWSCMSKQAVRVTPCSGERPAPAECDCDGTCRYLKPKSHPCRPWRDATTSH